VVVVVVVLIVTNLVTIATLLYFLYGPLKPPGPDPATAAALDRLVPQRSTRGVRRLITIEILNPIELAGARGRWAGVASSLAPGLTRRMVYDQALRLVRRQLIAERVVADVRVHTLRPTTPQPGPPATRNGPDLEPAPGTRSDEVPAEIDDAQPPV
jgi:hypothetical protein